MQTPPQLAITLTTINDGRFLERFRPLLMAGGERVSMIIAGDRKTPPECAIRVQQMAADGLNVRYLGLDAQEEIMGAAGLTPEFIPFNSDNRRNLAVLEAWRTGADVFISLDDDNFPLEPQEFINCYSQVGRVQRLPAATCEGRWPNVCAMLDIRSGWTDEPVALFARGHPHTRRTSETIALSLGQEQEATVLAHVGLWEGHPDVDAAARATLDPVSRGMLRPNVLLAPANARAPMSTQNIAVARALIPAWWYVRMGPMKSGRPLDRFGDMFQAYFSSMVIEALGGRFAFGAPLVRHERNPHALLRDLAGELSGMALLEDLLAYLETVPPGATAVEAYRAIAEGLADALPAGGGMLGDDARRWADETAESMVAWTHACTRLSRE
jgi:hypothetical protein